MSSQPSTLSQVKAKASTAYDTLASTDQNKTSPNEEGKDPANFTRDFHGNTVKKGDLKDQLNEAAFVGGGPKEPEGFVEKALSYIPGVKGLQKQGEPGLGKEGPPNRPEHDVQVEEFLRGQYHSRSGDGMPNPDAVRK